MSALKTQIEIPLSVPVTVTGADGKDAERSKLTMRRPKVRHTKRLAALIGKDLIDILAGDDGVTDKDGKTIAREIFGHLLNQDKLDGLTLLLADLCGEDEAVIEDIDAVDIVTVGWAFAAFFPALQSLASGQSPAISPSSDATTPA